MNKNQPDKGDLHKLANSLSYFESMVNDEIERISHQLTNRIEESADPFEQLSIVTNELIEQIAAMSARIKVIEQAVVVKKDASDLEVRYHSKSPITLVGLLDVILIEASNFAETDNMYGLEHTGSGLSYCWSGPEPETVFDLPVRRNKNKTLRVKFISIASEELMKNIVISVNGDPLPYKLRFDGQCQVIECKLKKLQNELPTKLIIKLPKTISPYSQGLAGDKRKLGLAIVSVGVD